MQGAVNTNEDSNNKTSYILNDLSGILPRTSEFLFNEIQRLQKMNNNYKVFLSAIEIYNENVYDLFDKEKQPLTISYIKNQCHLKNLSWFQISNQEDFIDLTIKAFNLRRSETTIHNDYSSRSHAIFQIKLESKNLKLNQDSTSFINIIDLAGSEKCVLTSLNNKSNQEIETMKKLQLESANINRSLTTLGRIISILADKKTSKIGLPYRESKLTMVLQVKLKIFPFF